MKTRDMQTLMEIVLSGAATDAEKHQLDAWINESEENKVEFEQLKVVWLHVNNLYNTEEFDIEAAKLKVAKKVNVRQKKTQTIKYYWLSAAASILILLGVFILKPGTSYKLAYEAEKKSLEIVLDDGTIVWLNKESKLYVAKNFNKKTRAVKLTGEAFFEVKRNERKPFKIETGITVTQVLGTSFNLYEKQNGDIKLTVETGKVAFYKKNQLKKKLILNAQEKAVFNNKNKKIKLNKEKDKNFLAWKTGVLEFYDTPMAEVCEQLSKYYSKKVEMNSNLNDFSLTGSFENESLSDILYTIELTLDIKIDSTNNSYLLVK